MVYNRFIKCQVCGTVTRIRLQVGLLKGHPVVVACCNCGTSMNGYVDINQECPGLRFQFENEAIHLFQAITVISERFFVSNNPNALIVDFFTGSGTTPPNIFPL